MQSSVDLQFFCIWDPSLLWFEKAPADIMALFSWLQNRHKIHVVGGRPVERSMMSVTLVQSIKCSEVKGNFYSMEKCWCSVHNPHSYSSPSDINCTLFLNVFFLKKASCLTVYRPADGYRHLNTDADALNQLQINSHTNKGKETNNSQKSSEL